MTDEKQDLQGIAPPREVLLPGASQTDAEKFFAGGQRRLDSRPRCHFAVASRGHVSV